VIEGVRSVSATGFSSIAASESGTFVYVQGSTAGGVALQWATAGAAPAAVRTALLDASSVAVAPDGHRVALDVHDGTQHDIWLYEHARDALTRLTSDTTDEIKPLWSPDGLRITFAVMAAKQAPYAIAWRRADSNGAVQRLVESAGRLYPGSWHPSGRLLAYVDGAEGNTDIRILPIDGNETAGWKPGTPTTFAGTQFAEHEPAFSPDGQWMAYMSNETGRHEVYVRPFPGPGGQVPISTTGGLVPRWSPSGKELFYLRSDGTPMVVPFTAGGGAFRPEKARVWSDLRVALRGASRSYDLHPDGRMMILQEPEGQNTGNAQRLTFVFNAFDEVRRKAPAK
jgi:Tol biopolymer transport system component